MALWFRSTPGCRSGSTQAECAEPGGAEDGLLAATAGRAALLGAPVPHGAATAAATTTAHAGRAPAALAGGKRTGEDAHSRADAPAAAPSGASATTTATGYFLVWLQVSLYAINSIISATACWTQLLDGQSGPAAESTCAHQAADSSKSRRGAAGAPAAAFGPATPTAANVCQSATARYNLRKEYRTSGFIGPTNSAQASQQANYQQLLAATYQAVAAQAQQAPAPPTGSKQQVDARTVELQRASSAAKQQQQQQFSRLNQLHATIAAGMLPASNSGRQSIIQQAAVATSAKLPGTELTVDPAGRFYPVRFQWAAF